MPTQSPPISEDEIGEDVTSMKENDDDNSEITAEDSEVSKDSLDLEAHKEEEQPELESCKKVQEMNPQQAAKIICLKQSKRKFIEYVGHRIDFLKKRNAIIALKYQDVKWYHDGIQISAILVSTVLTCMETVKAEFGISTSTNVALRRSFALMPIFFSSYIALSMSLLKFKRYTESLESMTKVSEKTVYTSCRLRRVQENTHNTSSLKELKDVKKNYSLEPFDLYMNVREDLERLLKFRELVSYKNKYEVLKAEADAGEINLPWYKRICRCCRKKNPLETESEPRHLRVRIHQEIPLITEER